MSLAKYQVKALVSEVQDRIKEKKKELQETEEYEEKLREISVDLLEDLHFSDLADLHTRKEELLAELDEIKSSIKDINEGINEVVDRKVYSYSKIDRASTAINELAEKKTDEEFGFGSPSRSEIQNAVIVADLSDSDDVIETVLEKVMS